MAKYRLSLAMVLGITTMMLSACSKSTPGSNEGPSPRGGEPAIDWDQPLGPGATQYPSVAAAASQLTFQPIMSIDLGSPFAVLVGAGADASTPNLAIEFGASASNRFLITEAPSQTTQAALESLAACDASQGCEGTRSLIALADGTNGLVVTGPSSNGILWLQSGLLMDVFGPPDSFSVSQAVSVANSLSSVPPGSP
jgi:hypothetical protein